MELLINLCELRLQVLCHAVAELLDGVDASLLEQLGKLGTYAIDAEQVGVVGPAENELFADARGLCQLLAALGGGTLLEQLAHLLNTCGNQLLSISVAYSFDVNNLVIHNPNCF